MLAADRHVAQHLALIVKRHRTLSTTRIGKARKEVDSKRPKARDADLRIYRAILGNKCDQDRRPKRESIQNRSLAISKTHSPNERHLCSNQEIVLFILERIRAIGYGDGDSDLKPFANKLRTTLRAWKDPNSNKDIPPVFASLRQAYIDNALQGITMQIKYLYHRSVANLGLSKFKFSMLEQRKLVDLRYPVEWFPATRSIQRMIHLHVGPTNSGKTYNALKRLEQATSGIYAGPLRLLAHEIYVRLNMNGKACNLVTGDERIIKDGNVKMNSCTVEMVPINTDVDVAVIDEIQMIGDDSRGSAWTQALLGIKAKELHLCGETRTVPLIRELAAAMGDKLEIHRYERLSPLKLMRSSLHCDLRTLRKGDCIVAFSRISIHALKREIEKLTNKRVAVVYGSLPPEIRAQQASLFNDPNNDYDILVGSDAIGMGLNLSIKRLIFESTLKFDGQSKKTLPDNDIKQIAGRAGRYRTVTQAQDDEKANLTYNGNVREQLQNTIPVPKYGLVTTLVQADYPTIMKAMQSEPEPLLSAGLFPPTDIIFRFANHFPPGTPFTYILLRLSELSLLHPRFRICLKSDALFIADIIHSVPNLTLRDRTIFINAPASSRNLAFMKVIQALARCVANSESGVLLDIKEINLSILDKPVSDDKSYLDSLETLHRKLILYLWLSYRFPEVFTTQDMAFYVKGLVEVKINAALTSFSSRPDVQKTLKTRRYLFRPEGHNPIIDKTDQRTIPSNQRTQPNLGHPSQIAEDGIAESMSGGIVGDMSVKQGNILPA